MAPHFTECTCYFQALGIYNELDHYCLNENKIKKAYRKVSLLCHPDKHPENMKKLTTAAQQMINQAREIISDERRRFNYLDEGDPPEGTDHTCTIAKEVLDFIKNQIDEHESRHSAPKAKAASPDNQHISDTKEESFEPDQERIDSTYNPCDDPLFNFDGPNDSRRSSQKRDRRRSSFEPAGYQHMGGTIIDNKQRSQGTVYKMQWKSKPDLTSWIHEADIVKHFPFEAKEYLAKLKKEKSRKLQGIIRKAGPMCDFL